MSRHLITVEVDTDLTRYGTPWAADYSSAPMPTGDVADYAKTFGAGSGDQWDEPPFTRVVSVEPVAEEDNSEGVHADLGVSPFRTVDVGHVPLHRLADGEVFEDAGGKRWRKRHAGPTQSGVRIETLDGKLWQDYDLSTRVHQLDHEHAPRAGSRNRLTADAVEYQCDSCGVFYGVAE